jgi:hypothetical protein
LKQLRFHVKEENLVKNEAYVCRTLSYCLTGTRHLRCASPKMRIFFNKTSA